MHSRARLCIKEKPQERETQIVRQHNIQNRINRNSSSENVPFPLCNIIYTVPIYMKKDDWSSHGWRHTSLDSSNHADSESLWFQIGYPSQF